jgi:hypothetical protein
MEKVSVDISVVFIVTTFLTLFFFQRASGKSGKVVMISAVWLVLQAILGLRGFYTVTDTTPPRFLLLVAPVILLIIILFTTTGGRRFIDSLDIKWLTLLSVVRLPVEICLFVLYTYKVIPVHMTFEGRNYDILSGLTAPLVYYFGFVKNRMGRGLLLAWNFICLGLLINVVAHGILSVPSSFQRLSYDQPNIAILYFPFVWLPSVIVTLVLFSHLISIRRLWKG